MEKNSLCLWAMYDGSAECEKPSKYELKNDDDDEKDEDKDN